MTEFPNALLTSRQVARILKVNINRVGEYAAAGRLTFVYTPPASDKKFRISDVNKFIASRRASYEACELKLLFAGNWGNRHQSGLV